MEDLVRKINKMRDGETWDEFVQRKIYESEKQYEEGRYLDAEEVFKMWKE